MSNITVFPERQIEEATLAFYKIITGLTYVATQEFGDDRGLFISRSALTNAMRFHIEQATDAKKELAILGEALLLVLRVKKEDIFPEENKTPIIPIRR